MATSQYLRRRGATPASGSLFESLGLDGGAVPARRRRQRQEVAVVPPVPAPATAKSGKQLAADALLIAVPPSQKLFDALSLDPGNALRATAAAARRGRGTAGVQAAKKVGRIFPLREAAFCGGGADGPPSTATPSERAVSEASIPEDDDSINTVAAEGETCSGEAA